MAETVCPKCKAKAECFCNAGGKNGDFDEFFLVCESCGHKESAKKMIGSPDALFGSFSEEYPSCPFCGQICREHKTPPTQVFDIKE